MTAAENRTTGINRKATLVAAAANGTAMLLTLAAFWLLLPDAPAAAPDLAERLDQAARVVVWPVVLLLAMVAATAISRVETAAFDPLRDREGRLYQINQRVLTNTVEQTMMFVPAAAAGAILFDPVWLTTLPLAAWFFVTGRLMFWIGYLLHPYARSPGMVITIATNLILAAGLLATVLD